MRHIVILFSLVCYLAGPMAWCQAVAWNEENGALTVSGGSKTFTTYVATNEEEVRKMMTHVNFSSPFTGFKGQHKGGIVVSSIQHGGEVVLKVFSYDRHAAGGKGKLVYGCRARQSGFHEDAWVEVTTGHLWWKKRIYSHEMDKLAQDHQLYLPENCQGILGPSNTTAAWGIMGAGFLIAGGIVAAPFTMGSSLTLTVLGAATAIGVGGGLVAGAVATWPDECKAYGVPFQPVVVELSVTNATVGSVNIPGSRDHMSPEEVFYPVYPHEHYCSQNPHAAPCKIFTRTKLPNFDQPEDIMVLAHRGYWGNDLGNGVPENSAGALDFAHANGVDAVEVDVMPTLTNANGDPESVVLLHDYNLERLTTDESGEFTFTKSEAYLSTLNLKKRNETVSTEKLTTVDQLIDRCIANGMVVFIDMKELQSNGSGANCKANCDWQLDSKKVMSWLKDMKKAIDKGKAKNALQYLAFKTYYEYTMIRDSLSHYGLDKQDLKKILYMPMIVSNAPQWKTNGVADVQKICDFIDRWQQQAGRSVVAFETNFFSETDVLLQAFSRNGNHYENVLEYVAKTTGRRSGIFSEEPVGPQGVANRWGQWKMKDTSTDMRGDHFRIVAPAYGKYMLITSDRPDIWKQIKNIY